MSRAYRCSVCGIQSADLDRFDTNMRCELCVSPRNKADHVKPLLQTAPVKQVSRLPRYDPVMQEAEDLLARRHGREVARQMIDDEECDSNV